MGNAGSLRRYHTHGRYRLGWLSDAYLLTNPNGRVRLMSASAPISTPASSGAQLIRLASTSNPSVRPYWISWRASVGSYDVNLGSSWSPRVFLHRDQATSSSPNAYFPSSLLIHTGLRVGEVYVDNTDNIRIEVVSMDTISLIAEIDVGFACNLKTPTFALEGPGADFSHQLLISTCDVTTTHQFHVVVTNNDVARLHDDVSCAPFSNFVIIPEFWEFMAVGRPELQLFGDGIFTMELHYHNPSAVTWEVSKEQCY